LKHALYQSEKLQLRGFRTCRIERINNKGAWKHGGDCGLALQELIEGSRIIKDCLKIRGRFGTRLVDGQIKANSVGAENRVTPSDLL
jgi:hypothetical protein